MDRSARPDPDTVAVSGTAETPDRPVEMLEGATGARIPTGNHRQSGAMASIEGSSGQRGGLGILAVAALALVFLALVAYALTR